MPASIQTNWGKAAMAAAYYQGTDHEGNALPAAHYIILLNSSFPGFSGNNTNPDYTQMSEIAAYALNPSLYTGSNTVARSGVGFTTTQDNGNDRGSVSFTTAPVITASGSVADVQGYALVTANNLTTARIAHIERFSNGPFSLSATQTLTINGAQGLIG